MKRRVFVQPERGALKRKQELHIKIMRVSSLGAITFRSWLDQGKKVKQSHYRPEQAQRVPRG
jgi:hypothetical protein